MVEVLLIILLLISFLFGAIIISSALLLVKIFEKIKEIGEIQLHELEEKQRNKGLLDVPETSQIPYNLTSRR